jgi:hypothetical protein
MKTYTVKEQLNKEYIVFEETEDSKVVKGIFYTKGEAEFYASVLERSNPPHQEEE